MRITQILSGYTLAVVLATGFSAPTLAVAAERDFAPQHTGIQQVREHRDHNRGGYDRGYRSHRYDRDHHDRDWRRHSRRDHHDYQYDRYDRRDYQRYYAPRYYYPPPRAYFYYGY